MDDLDTDVGNLVESFFGDVADRARPPKGRPMTAPMDVQENEDLYLVTMDVPGVPIESIEIDVHEDTLTISGRRGAVEAEPAADECCSGDECGTEEKSGANETGSTPAAYRTLRRERGNGRFERKIQLPLAVEPDGVSAELDDGVLSVRLPKADPDRGKRRIRVSRR